MNTLSDCSWQEYVEIRLWAFLHVGSTKQDGKLNIMIPEAWDAAADDIKLFSELPDLQYAELGDPAELVASVKAIQRRAKTQNGRFGDAREIIALLCDWWHIFTLVPESK